MKNNSRPWMVWFLFYLQILLGLGAFVSGFCFLLFPDGSLIGMPLSILKYSPFKDFFIPGLILFSLLGVYPLIVAFCLLNQPSWRWPNWINPFKKYHWAWAASISTGIILIIWITTQVLLIRDIHFLHLIYFVWGWVIILISSTQIVRQHLKMVGK